jgi:uncharacterized protein (DUF3084 family)
VNIFGIGFLILVCLVGGGIAVFADNLGRTLGKKRLSLMKLRPRKTAQVITFMAGAIIPLLTVGAVMWTSRDVRRWFAEGPGVIDERDRLLSDVGGLRSQRAQLEKLRQEQLEEIKRGSAQLAALERQLADSKKRYAESQAKVASLTGRVASLSRQAQALTARAKKLTEDVGSLNSQLSVKTAELAAKLREYEQLDRSFAILSSERDEAYRENIRLQGENIQLQTQIQTSKEELEKQIAKLTSDFELSKTTFEAELRRKQREVELATMDLDAMQGQLERAKRDLEQMGDIWLNSRRLPMVYRMGQEIARVQVPANMSREQAENELTALVRAARNDAEQKGAKPKPGFPSAGLMNRLDADGRMLTSEMQRERIVNRLTGLSEELVLVATSSLNAFHGEPVSLDIQSFRNPIVFQEGEMVAESRLDGDKAEEIIFSQLSDFVMNQLQEAAKGRGMIPMLGDPNGYGVVSQSELLELVRSARAVNRPVRIQAFATKAIRAGDALALNFRLR